MNDSASYSSDLSLDLPIADSMKAQFPKAIDVVKKPEGPKPVDANFVRRLMPSLSIRESEVAAEVCLGFANKAIADRLFVVEKTVKFHLTNIFKKAQVKSRAQLIVKVTQAKA